MKSKRHFQFDYISITMTIGILLYLAVLVLPLLLSFFYSFTNFNLLNATNSFIGFKNYVSMLNDDTFLSTLRFTIETTIIVTLLTNVFGLIIASALNQTGSFYTVLRTVFFIPQVLSSVVIGFIWRAWIGQHPASPGWADWHGWQHFLARHAKSRHAFRDRGMHLADGWLLYCSLSGCTSRCAPGPERCGKCGWRQLLANFLQCNFSPVIARCNGECSHVINHDVQAVRHHPGDDSHWTSWFDRVPGILRDTNGIHSEQGWLCLGHGSDIVYFHCHDFSRIGQVLTQPRG